MFNWLFGRDTSAQLPDIFPFPCVQGDFVRTDVVNIYRRILTDVLERTEGLKEEQIPLLWDNCLGSESQDGLVSLVACAMYNKSDLYLVYDRTTDVIRKATSIEEAQIKVDYAAKTESKVGFYITFKNYHRSDMVKLYSLLEYCTVGSLYKQMNLSKAIQIKLTALRESVSAVDQADVKAQLVNLAQALKDGKDIGIDAKDIIETSKPDLTATQSSMEFIAEKRSFYLGLPCSWITGETSKGGLSDTGHSDAKAVERGLKGYYFEIIKPLVEAIFDTELTFKSEDFEQLSTALEALKVFNVTDEEFMSADTKLKLVNKFFGLPEDTEGGPKAPPPVIVAPGGVVPPKPGQQPPPAQGAKP